MKSLEHTIRSIVSGQQLDEMNLPTPDHEFVGNQFTKAGQQVPKIRPPKSGDAGGSHDAKNAGRQRTIAKEKASHTMHVEEQQLDEVVPALAIPALAAISPEVAAGTAAAAGMAGYYGSKMLKKLTGSKSYDPETAKANDSYMTAAQRMKSMKPTAAQMDAATKQEIKPGAPPPIMTMKPPEAPAKLSADRPAMPGIIATKPAEAPAKQEVKTATPATVVKPGEVAVPKADTKAEAPAIPKTQVDAKAVPQAQAVPKAQEIAKADTQTQAVPKAETGVGTAAKVATAAAAATALAPRIPGFPGVSGSSPGLERNKYHPLSPHAHSTKQIAIKHKVYEASEGTEKRMKEPNVGRPDTAPSNFDKRSKLGKQGEIKTKFIDEAAKKNAMIIKNAVKDQRAVYSGQTIDKGNVIINPPMKQPNPEDYK